MPLREKQGDILSSKSRQEQVGRTGQVTLRSLPTPGPQVNLSPGATMGGNKQNTPAKLQGHRREVTTSPGIAL